MPRQASRRARSRTRPAWERPTSRFALVCSPWGLQAPTNTERNTRNHAKARGSLARPWRRVLPQTLPASPWTDPVATAHSTVRLLGMHRREPARSHTGPLHSEQTVHSTRNSTTCPPLPASAMSHAPPRRRPANFHRAPHERRAGPERRPPSSTSNSLRAFRSNSLRRNKHRRAARLTDCRARNPLPSVLPVA